MDNEIKPNITSASYIGRPINNTVMFITKKVEHLLVNLDDKENCLIFCEDSIDIPDKLRTKHTFVKTPNPNLEYTKYVQKIALQIEEANKKRKYILTQGGYYIGENVLIGENAYIEPLCLIGHDVIIGDNARIYSGVKIKNAIIGDNFLANENSVVGSNGYTMSKDENGNNIRLPNLGKLIIGNNVEIGSLSNVCIGSAGDSIIGDNVKVDSIVQIGHDNIIGKNSELVGGTVTGGFVTLEDNAYLGISASLRNRITIGENSIVGMGGVVTKNVSANITVIGNPAKPYEKK